MTRCMVSAPQPEAVEAGLDAFNAGGNVMDAAIAAATGQLVTDLNAGLLYLSVK